MMETNVAYFDEGKIKSVHFDDGTVFTKVNDICIGYSEYKVHVDIEYFRNGKMYVTSRDLNYFKFKDLEKETEREFLPLKLTYKSYRI